MKTATVHIMSRSLGRHVTYSMIMPDLKDAGPGPYPVLYQLHGASDDHMGWIVRSNLARHAAQIPLFIVCPDGGLSYWLNAGPRERYEDFLMHDLPEHLHNTYNIRPGKSAIGGLSMGGYGALRLALKYPDQFASVWAHSAALWTKDDFPADSNHLARALINLPDADIYSLAAQASGRQLPVISFDCGTADFLINHNRRFHTYLNDIGIPHTYNEHPGAHTWDYWDTHVKEALAQHVRVLGLPATAL